MLYKTSSTGVTLDFMDYVSIILTILIKISESILENYILSRLSSGLNKIIHLCKKKRIIKMKVYLIPKCAE